MIVQTNPLWVSVLGVGGDADDEGAWGASRVCLFFLVILLISDSFRLRLKDECLQALQPSPATYVDSRLPPVSQGRRCRFRGNGHRGGVSNSFHGDLVARKFLQDEHEPSSALQLFMNNAIFLR